MIKVSVIVPVYNGELYLEQCMDSICGQTLREIEIICVDDGSTDASCEILERYRERDSRVKIFRQKNRYAGAARNTGKAHAAGEYLVFWDCDDFFAPEALEQMYQRAKEYEADICVCGAFQYLQEKGEAFPVPGYMNKKRIPDEPVFSRETNQRYILNFTNVPAWNKMYRREFVEKEALDFQPIRNGNDVFFTMNALCAAGRITALETPLVYYRKNQKQSLMGTLSKAPFAPFRAWIDTAESLEEKGRLPEQSFVNAAVENMIFLLRNLPDRKAFLEVVRFLREEGVEKLHIFEREEEYYNKPWYGQWVSHLLRDTPEDFQMYLSYVTYIQFTEDTAAKRLAQEKNKKLIKENKELRKENSRLKQKIEMLQDSWSFKIGKALVWLPGKGKQLLKGGKKPE